MTVNAHVDSLEWDMQLNCALCSQGDSGGPLVCTTDADKKWYQVGVISWGRSCGRKNTPGIYTVVEKYRHWIKKVMEVEGRPHSLEQRKTTSRQQRMMSRASKLPEPGSPPLRLLLCLLSRVPLQAVFSR